MDIEKALDDVEKAIDRLERIEADNARLREIIILQAGEKVGSVPRWSESKGRLCYWPVKHGKVIEGSGGYVDPIEALEAAYVEWEKGT